MLLGGIGNAMSNITAEHAYAAGPIILGLLLIAGGIACTIWASNWNKWNQTEGMKNLTAWYKLWFCNKCGRAFRPPQPRDPEEPPPLRHS